jgi:hypothetical protein
MFSSEHGMSIKDPDMKALVWWIVFIFLLGGAYAFGQTNARFYREPIARLDYQTTIDVVGDVLGAKCYGVMVFRNRQNAEIVEAAVSLGPVICGKDGRTK